MERATKIAIMIISVISFIFAASVSVYLNSAYSGMVITYMDKYIEHIGSGGLVTEDYETVKSICEFDITGPDFTCINMSTGLGDCSDLLKNPEEFRFFGPIDMNDCDKDKLDAAFDDEVSLGHITLSINFGFSNLASHYRSSLQDSYSKEMFFSMGKLADVFGLLLVVMGGGATWTGLISDFHACVDEYNRTEKSERCINSIVASFESISSELRGDTSFDSKWEEQCSKVVLQELGGIGSSSIPFVDLLLSVNSGEMCSRMGKVMRDIQDSADKQPLNKVEKLYIAAVLHTANKYKSDEYKPLLLAEKIGERLDPEFQEVKDDIKKTVDMNRKVIEE